MILAKEKVLFGVTILSVFCVMAACSPNPDTRVPTQTIVIKNIPATIYNTDNREGSAEDIVGKPLFKVFVQLSNYSDANHDYSALGDVEVSGDEGKSGSGNTYTLAIDNFKDPHGESWSGTNWTYLSVVISPEDVDDVDGIFDIDIKAGIAGASDSSTVSLDWNNLLPKINMKYYPNEETGIRNYKRLYGFVGRTDGVIITDPIINPVVDPETDPPTFKLERLDDSSDPTSFGQLRYNNDFRIP